MFTKEDKVINGSETNGQLPREYEEGHCEMICR